MSRKTKLLIIRACVLLTASTLTWNGSSAQDSSAIDKAIVLPEKFFSLLDDKASGLQSKLNAQTDKYLNQLQKQEARLTKKLWKKDSALAKELFPSDLAKKYKEVQSLVGNLSSHSVSYSGHLDSLATALNFLKQTHLTISNPEIEKLLSNYKSLQQTLNVTNQTKAFLQERQRLLKSQLEKVGMIKELQRFRKQVYYYQAQIKEYRELFENPSKMEAKLMELVMKVPQFKEFFANNSALSSLFALQTSHNAVSANLQGLQTRALVTQGIADRLGSGADVSQMMRDNLQSAQGQLGELKDKLNQLSSGTLGNTSSDIDAPDFKPNSQKTKSFLKRLELGTNIQSQKARQFFPVTSDLGVSIGYKLNDKSIVGVGASGKIGWGSGWNNISITYQGIGLRSFIDYQIKSSFRLNGGFEMNYRNLISSIQQLQNYSSWQKSGLLGISKKYVLSKKLKGEMKLLWDFLSYEQIPKTQAVLFRISYCLK